MTSQQFSPSDRQRALLGDGGAFVMGKTDFEVPGLRRGWLLAQVAILIPEALLLSLNSDYFLQLIL